MQVNLLRQHATNESRRRTLQALRLGCFALCSLLAAFDLPGQSHLANGAEDAEDSTIEAMCRVGLTQAAVDYVSAQRDRLAADPSANAKWTMRLIECHAFAALHAPQSAGEHWRQCDAEFEEFVRRDPRNPRLPWLKWQTARCHFLHAQAALAQHLAAPGNGDAREKALAMVRVVLQDLEQLMDDVKQRQPLAARQGPSGGDQAPAEQLAKLAIDASLLRCEALLIRMRIYPDNSADRVAAATDAERLATDVLQRTEADWLSRDPLRVARATALLELGRSSDAILQLEQIARESDNRQSRVRAGATAIEWLSANQSLSRARTLKEQLATEGDGPELRLAEIELLLADARTRTGSTQQELLSQVLQNTKALHARFGDYWRNRGEALLVSSGQIAGQRIGELQSANATNTPAGEKATEIGERNNDASLARDLLSVEIRQLLSAGQDDRAIERLLSFSKNEAAVGQVATALETARQAAELLQRQERWLTASETLAAIAVEHSTAPKSAEAHVQAIVAASEALRGAVGRRSLREWYERLLKQHFAYWPDSPTADQAEQWLAAWLTSQGRSSDLAAAVFDRALASREASQTIRSLLAWLGLTLNLESSEASVHRSRLDTVLEGNRFSKVQEKATLVQAVVWSLTGWPNLDGPEPTHSLPSSQALTQTSSENGQDAQDKVLEQLRIGLRGIVMLRAERSSKNALAQFGNWDLQNLTADIGCGFARSLVTAIDETPTSEHAILARSLGLNQAMAESLLGRSELSNQAAGCRILIWNGDTKALDQLRELVAKAGRTGGELQLQLANALADAATVSDSEANSGGERLLTESSQIARVLIANSEAGSDLDLSARWRLIKNQLASRDAQQNVAGRRAAKLLLAVQPPRSVVWKERFESAAK